MNKVTMRNSFRKINFPLLILFIAGFFVISGNGKAESFPFRSLEVGTPIPDLTLSGYKNEADTSIHALAGKPMLFVFWGGDLEAKKKRTIKILKVVKDLSSYLKENGVVLIVVNAQNDTETIVNEVMEAAELSTSLYVDSSRTVYEKFGLYVLPSLLLVDAKGNVSGGVGYSKDIAQRLRGEVDIMLGKKTHEELEAELNPEMKEVPQEEKLALRHMNMGITMKHKGMLDSAVRELQQALELNPKLAEARVELGCLYVEQDKLDEAIKELEAGLEQNSDLLNAEICLGKVSAKMGEVNEALADMQALVFRHGRNSDLHYLIGSLQEQLGSIDEAAKSYKKAYELLKQKTTLHE
ncbi:MAG: tetratricopeptide repeat protein [Desulfocapsa sp.]|nr:tetratricopeptide repeat protein [Desulfocapsa sp.]